MRKSGIRRSVSGNREWLRVECRDRLPGNLLKVLVTFDKYMLIKGADEYDMEKQN